MPDFRSSELAAFLVLIQCLVVVLPVVPVRRFLSMVHVGPCGMPGADVPVGGGCVSASVAGRSRVTMLGNGLCADRLGLGLYSALLRLFGGIGESV